METLPHVLWLGGAPGSGKSTVARRIARRRGLRWYQSDPHTWDHRRRATQAGVASALHFDALTPAERIAQPMRVRVAMALQQERGPMIVDDLRALPPSPLIIAEGAPVLPDAVPVGARALWLTVSPDRQRARLAARHAPDPAPELYLRLGQEISDAATRASVPQLRVDDLTIDQVVESVEEFFAPELRRGPTASSAAERRALLRYANRAEVQRYVDYFARPDSDSGGFDAAFSTFWCECDQTDCDAFAELRIADFPGPPDDGSDPFLAHARLSN